MWFNSSASSFLGFADSFWGLSVTSIVMVKHFQFGTHSEQKPGNVMLRKFRGRTLARAHPKQIRALRRECKSGGVASGGHFAAMAGPVRMKKLAARLIDALIGVRPEKVALCLQQVRRKPGGAIAVIKR